MPSIARLPYIFWACFWRWYKALAVRVLHAVRGIFACLLWWSRGGHQYA